MWGVSLTHTLIKEVAMPKKKPSELMNMNVDVGIPPQEEPVPPEDLAIDLGGGYYQALFDIEVEAFRASYGFRGRYWEIGEKLIINKGEVFPHHFMVIRKVV